MSASIRIELKISTPANLNEAELLELVKDELKGGWMLGGPNKQYPVNFRVISNER